MSSPSMDDQHEPSETLDIFRYEPLDHSQRSTSLLRLQPLTDAGGIRVELRHEVLVFEHDDDDPNESRGMIVSPEYKALSYE
jgi:hypothetical protein